MEQSLKKRFLGNTGWLLAQNIYSMLLSLIVGSLSARYLGPSNYGLIGYGTSLVSLFTAISRLGLDAVVINEIITCPQKRGSYIGTALVMRLCASVLSIFAIEAFVLIIEPGNTDLLWITLFQAIAIVLQIHEIFNYWFQSELKSKYVVIASSIALTISSIWRIVLLKFGANVYWFALSSSIQALVILLVTSIIFQRDFRSKLTCSFSDMKYLFSKSKHFIIANLAITIYTQTDKIMIGKFLNEEALGFYTAAMTVATLWEFVPQAIVNSARPIVIKNRASNYSDYIKKEQYLLLVITGLGILAGLGFTLFGKLVLHILYGEEYMSALSTLYILIWSTSLAMIGTARSVWIIAEELYAYQKNMVLIGAVLNVFLNIVLIKYIGINGAAISTLLSQISVQFIAPLLFRETRMFVRIYFSSFRYLGEIAQDITGIFRK